MKKLMQLSSLVLILLSLSVYGNNSNALQKSIDTPNENDIKTCENTIAIVTELTKIELPYEKQVKKMPKDDAQLQTISNILINIEKVRLFSLKQTAKECVNAGINTKQQKYFFMGSVGYLAQGELDTVVTICETAKQLNLPAYENEQCNHEKSLNKYEELKRRGVIE
jgi:hypothetical protein